MVGMALGLEVGGYVGFLVDGFLVGIREGETVGTVNIKIRAYLLRFLVVFKTGV